MRKKIIGVIALFSFGFIACQNHSSTFKDAKTFDLNSFSVTKELKGVSHTFNDEIMKPIRLQVYDSLLITINVGENKLLTVYNLNTYTKIGSRINLGDGPLEMFQPNFIKGDDKNISLYDMGKSTISKYDISDFVHNADPVPVKQIKLSQNIFNDVVFDGEENIIAPVYRDQSLFSIFNQNGEKVGNFGAYPESGLQMTDAEKREMFQFTYASNSNGKMALCYSWNDLIDIYNEEKQLACRIHGPIQFTSSFKEFRDGEVSSAHPEQGKQRDAYYNPVAADDVFFSCKKHSNTEDLEKTKIVTYKVSEIDVEPLQNVLSTYFTEPTFVKLRSKDISTDFGKISKVKLQNQYIYILDQGIKSLVVYDKEGYAVGKVGQKGQGPNEYLDIADFDIDKQGYFIA